MTTVGNYETMMILWDNYEAELISCYYYEMKKLLYNSEN